MKKIGNVLCGFLLLLMCSAVAQDDISVQLQVKTAQGAPLQQAGVGIPFMLNIIVHGASGAITTGSVEASDEFALRRQGSTNRMTSVGGSTTHENIFHYSVRADQSGTFTIGPAQILIDGQEYSSDVLTVEVAQQPVAHSTLRQPRLDLIVGNGDEDGTMVVGQTVPFIVRFYHLNSSQLQEITPPEVPGFVLGKLTGPTRGTATIEGVPYNYVEWRTYITAQKVGSFVIKPAHARYAMQSRQRSSLFQLLSDHFSFGMQEYETNSNVVHVTVDPLPPYDGPVHAVGSFTRIHASVQQTCAKQGEGIVYTLELMGDESLPRVPHPSLVLPDALTSYESKSSVHANRYTSSASQRKLFEYIIQAREPGQVTVPAQTFTFYDPYTQQYQDLVTEPIELSIIQADHGLTTSTQSSTHNAEQQEEPYEVPVEPAGRDQLPVYKGSWYPVIDVGFSPLVFWSFLFIILVALAAQWGRFLWQLYCTRNYDYLRQRAAFVTARRRLQQAKHERNAHLVYDMFITLFADRRLINKSQVTEEDIITWLQEAHMPEGTRSQWQEYVRQLQTYAFFDQATVPDHQLFDQAGQWLVILEKLV